MPTPSPARVHEFTVVTNKAVGENIFSLTIKAPRLAAMLHPGQFMNLQVPGNAMSLLRIPLSYAAADPEAGTVELWYAVVGEGTQRLSEMRPHATSSILGPGGHGWSVPEDANACPRALLVGGGIGIPPIVCLARALSERGISFDVCLGATTASKLVGAAEIEALSGCGELHLCTDDGSLGSRAFCTDPAALLLSGKRYAYVATCGPSPMMQKVAEASERAGVYCEASLERMMSCGFGACATCAVETSDGMKGACMAGPVFDASKVVSW
ncbi:dihydroorotate dehydrogenase electron transfer subunit [Collinsella sp. AGMB00827]|uniref:Dihydroorotate dehydrogenase electron transfer subunit n=1 Tax=Collinsella ureilytica TaxID=2869515 RepID=A0ABS7MKY9_9ACTN|nr:dihydroorotate dehydrogenase electron transfer subunit [Collinsella urealyticum]MBY4797957.1 dihydroorotate dehydrogenase electron transfer subunit [Collinsella urealyticum]